MNYTEIDYFTDESVARNPEKYYEYVRGGGDSFYLPHHGVLTIIGHSMGRQIFSDDERYSAINASSGPFSGLSIAEAEGDVSNSIESQRYKVPGGNLIATQDPPSHTRARSLLAHLFTPARLIGVKTFLEGLADRLIDGLVRKESSEIVGELAQPIATLVIARLLGLPEGEYPRFLGVRPPGGLGGKDTMDVDSLEGMALYFEKYVRERREKPCGDVLSDLANAKYIDGGIPTIDEIVQIATLLFSAGRDTTVSVIASAMKILAQDSELQDRIRCNQDDILTFVEEVLRLQGAIKANFRLTKTAVSIGGIYAPPGTTVMLLTGAMNRDPRIFINPDAIELERNNPRDHFAFGRGAHSCPGAQLARFELQVVIARILRNTIKIEINDREHGASVGHQFDYHANFMIRGLKHLHLIFEATPKAEG